MYIHVYIYIYICMTTILVIFESYSTSLPALELLDLLLNRVGQVPKSGLDLGAL